MGELFLLSNLNETTVSHVFRSGRLEKGKFVHGNVWIGGMCVRVIAVLTRQALDMFPEMPSRCRRMGIPSVPVK